MHSGTDPVCAWEGEVNHIFSYFPVSRNAGHMSTLILGYPVELPKGVTAWWAKAITSDKRIPTMERLMRCKQKTSPLE